MPGTKCAGKCYYVAGYGRELSQKELISPMGMSTEAVDGGK